MLEIASFGKSSTGKSTLLNVLFATDFFQHQSPPQVQEKMVSFANQTIRLIDTPGLSAQPENPEAPGSFLHPLVNQADLVLFVCDTSPSHQEYTALKQLITSGKPVLVLLNKADTLPDHQRTVLLQRLYKQLTSLVDRHNILTCSANPKPQSLINPYHDLGYVVTPDVYQVKQRLTYIVQAETPTLHSLKALSRQAGHIVADATKIEHESRLICRDYALGATASVLLAPWWWLDCSLMIAGLTLLIAELANNHELTIDDADIQAMDAWMRLEGVRLLWPIALVGVCSALFASWLPVTSLILQAFTAYPLTKIIGHACTRCFTKRKNNISALYQAIQHLGQNTPRQMISYRPAQFIERQLTYFANIPISSTLH